MKNYYDMLSAMAERHPDKICLTVDSSRWTYKELQAACDRLAEKLPEKS